MTGTLRVFCFGQFELHYQEAERRQKLPRPPTLKSQSLLAYLILSRERPLPREQLIGLFWGDRPGRKARQSLSTALWHIRRCLPLENTVHGDHHVIQFQWPGDVWVDAEVFAGHAVHDADQLQTLVDLHHADFMEGFYDDWVIDERYRLQSRYVEMLRQLMRHYEESVLPEEALQTALALLEQDPLHEEAHRAVMRANAHLGRRNAALAQYQACQRIVAEELDTEPTAETTVLYQAILDGEIEPVVTRSPIPVRKETTPPSSARHPLELARPPLVGRDAELTFLHDRWQATQSGRGSLVLVQGEAGIGKTHLITTFADELQASGTLVLTGRSYEFERLLPFQPLVEAIRPLLINVSADELGQIPVWVMAEVSRLLPELQEQHPDLRSHESTEASQEQTLLFSAMARLMSVLAAQRPLLLILEDCHWATGSTLQLVHYLARRAAELPILIICTARDEILRSDHPILAWRQQLHRDALAHVLTLKRLTEDDVRHLLGQLSGMGEAATPLAIRMHHETEGNPFFLIELTKTLFESDVLTLSEGLWQGEFIEPGRASFPLPASISEAIQVRVGRLSSDTRDVLHVTSVLGHEFDYELLTATFGHDDEAVLCALDDLLRHRLISEGRGATERDYVFTHHKIQEVVYSDIPTRRRQQIHAKAGQSMEAVYADQLDSVVAELAHHYDHGRRLKRSLTGKAVHYLQMAGEQAASRYAHGEALTYFASALRILAKSEIDARFRLLLAQSREFRVQGDSESLEKTLAELTDMSKHLTEDAERLAMQAELAIQRVGYGELVGDYAMGVRAAQSAVALAERANRRHLLALGYLKWGQIQFRLGDYAAARSHIQEALDLAIQLNQSQTEASALQAFSLIDWAQGNYVKSAEHAHRAVELSRQLHDLRSQGIALNSVGIANRYQGKYRQAKHYFEEALRIYEEIGDRPNQAVTTNNLAVVATDQGDVEGARGYLRQSLAIHRETGDKDGEALAYHNLAHFSRLEGDILQTEKNYKRCLQISRETGHRRLEAHSLRGLALVAADRGAFTRCRELQAESLKIYRQLGNRRGEAYVLGLRALALALIGEPAAGRASITDALEIAVEIGAADLKCDSLGIHAFILHKLGDHEAAREMARKAIETAQEGDELTVQASTYCVLGDALARLGQLGEAADAYQQAIESPPNTTMPCHVIEAKSSLARVRQAQGQLDQTLPLVEDILVHLDQHGIDGMREPFRVYLTCCDLLQAAGDDRAPDLLREAYRRLQERAAAIDDETQRRSFLENIAAHREIRTRFKTL